MSENLNSVIRKIKTHGQKFKTFSLSVWDIDDTLYNTETKINIVHPKTKRLITSLTTKEYADFHAQGPENIKKKYNIDSFIVDFSGFMDSSFFYKNAKKTRYFPKAVQEFSDVSNFFIILTARQNMNNPETFLSKFESDGLRIKTRPDRSHLIRLNSLGNKYKNKGLVLNDILKEFDNIKSLRYWDDSVVEVNSVTEIRSKFPKVKFEITRIIP